MRALAFASAFFMLLAPAGAQPAGAPPPPAVTVAGEGVAIAVPDLALVTSGVVTRAPSAVAALRANAAAMNKVFAELKSARIEDRDFGTVGVTVQPQYDYGDGSAPRAPRIVGYEARNAVTVRARDLDRLGELLDRLAAAGSNQIDGLVFDVSDREAKLDQARRAAVADAKRKAELLAAGAGARLGPVLAIDEQEGGAPVPFTARAKAMEDAAATPVARGEQELRVRITARWLLER